jgi:hypothetical protein
MLIDGILPLLAGVLGRLGFKTETQSRGVLGDEWCAVGRAGCRRGALESCTS